MTELTAVPSERQAEAVLQFWFGERFEYGYPVPSRGQLWFGSSADTDQEIQLQFGDWVTLALKGRLDSWRNHARSTLALVILLDQFTRNIFRGDASAFAGDGMARELVKAALEQGFEKALLPCERAFLYMPLEHSEDLADQDLCVTLFADLIDEVHPSRQEAARGN